jgi:hypothetical protein
MNSDTITFIAVSVIVLNGVVGYLIGTFKGRCGAGFVLGALGGPIGWIGVYLAEDIRVICSVCRGGVSEKAILCRHCGVDMREHKPAKEEVP